MRTVKSTPFPDSPELLTPKNLGDAVRAARTQSGMTLETAALTLGIAKQTLSDIELGKSTVSLGNAMLAANGLGVALFAVPAEDREPVKFKLKRS
jgi:transcriptional regulator with XRE-family HTH domain